MTATRTARLVVVGGGPGGYAAAFLAADLGLETTLVDPADNPGGVCLYRGCIPSKALLHVARLIRESREAADWGVSFGKPKVDLERLRAWKDEVVAQLTGGLGVLGDKREVNHVHGRGRFLDSHRLFVEQAEGKDHILEFEQAIIATGSCPSPLPMMPEDTDRVLDSTSALELPDIPRRLLVIGGGYIGLELGSVYAALGSKVTVVEMTGSLLPGVDGDLVRPLAKRLAEQVDGIHLNTKVVEVEEKSRGLRVTFESEDDLPAATFDRVLVAVGRRPNTRNLGLETTRVKLDDQGFILTDEQRRTDDPRLWAIGDVAGQPMLAHKASHEGRVAAEAIAGRATAFEPAAIPAVVFTDPEIAWCGLTENEARAAGTEVRTARFPWAASGRAATLGRSDGVTKLVVEPDTERVLGVGIAGPGAGELIAEGVLAVEMGATATDLKLSIHAHPTLSETVMESAEVLHGLSTHFYRPRRS